MKELYEEMLERKLFLDGVQQTQQTIGRLKELNLVIVRLQQLLICAVVVPKGTFTAEQVLTELNKCTDLMDAKIHFECEDL